MIFGEYPGKKEPIMPRCLGWITVITLTLLTTAAPGDELRLRIVGGESDLTGVPLLQALEPTQAIEPGPYRLQPIDDNGPPCPATVFRDGGQLHLTAVVDQLKAGQTREFRLVAGKPEGVTEWSIRGTLDGLDVLSGDEASGHHLIAGYRVGETKPYWYPLNGPGNLPMTRNYPMIDNLPEQHDHPHQRSLWFTHGALNGVDFWASDPLNKPNPRFGTIRETGRPLRISGPDFAALRTTDQWLDAQNKPVCDDVRTVRIWDTGSARIFDFTIEIKAAHGPVTFGDTKEGAFGVRVPSTMAVDSKKGGRIVNAEGLADGAAWGKPSPWVDYSGPIDDEMVETGQVAGLAILDHPDNLRHPTTWHVREYGLFAANPFGYHDFGVGKPGEYTIPEGESLRFRYRVVLHSGGAATAKLQGHFDGFARPPRVEIIAVGSR